MLVAAAILGWAPIAHADNPDDQQQQDQQDQQDQDQGNPASIGRQVADEVNRANQQMQQSQQSGNQDSRAGHGLMYAINGVPTCAYPGDSFSNVQVVMIQPPQSC